MEEILEKTDGVPLFIEEVTRTVLQQTTLAAAAHGPDARNRPSIEVPETLTDSLLARLDRHPAGKELAQIGAVLGREFSHELLERIARPQGSGVDGTIERLVESGLLLPRGVGQERTYAFRHALVRDAAYETMLKSRRRELHGLAAVALEEIGQSAGSAEPELLAYHWTQAGQPARSIPHRLRAGRLALDRSAMAEAVAHLDGALELLAELPDRIERKQQEAELNVTLGAALAAAQGTGAAATGQAYGRAIELCEATGNTVHLLPALYGMIRFHVSRTELGPALALAERAVAATAGISDKMAQAVASYVSGWVNLAIGRICAAEESLDQVVRLLDAGRQRRVREACGIDLRILAQVYLSWCAVARGRPAAAQRLARETVAEAEALGHPLTLAATLDRACMVAGLLGQVPELALMAERLMEVGRTQCFTAYVWKGEFAQSWAEAESRSAGARIGPMRATLAALRANGDAECGAYLSGVLAHALERSGRLAEAEDVLTSALAHVEETGERCFECELHRRHAAVLLQSGRTAEAQAALTTAIDTAREQRAPLWELRATLDLAQLWQLRGEPHRAEELRASLVHRFGSSDETAELSEENLRTLLAALPMASAG